MKDEIRPIAWMLLRDGHAVPIAGLSPDELKESAWKTITRGDNKFGHQRRLNAIVDCFGLSGDFGDYVNTHWPRMQQILELRSRRNLFDQPPNDLTFRPSRRALADRLTLVANLPTRVFLGYDYDWSTWDRLFGEGRPGWWPEDDTFEPGDLETTRRWVYRHRTLLTSSATNFIGDQWLDVAPRATEPVLTMYRPTQEQDPRAARVMKALRWVLDRDDAGWVEVVPVSKRLVLLTTQSGAYDVVFANLRETPPPTHGLSEPASLLHPIDTPSSLQRDADFETWNYFRRDAWEEKEQHEAEARHYASGGMAGASYPGVATIVERHLRAEGIYGEKPRYPSASTTPDELQRVVESDGLRLLVSDLVTIAQMRTMMSDTGYLDRRYGDDWQPGNSDDPDHLPATATWYDAQAYCAWMERRLGVLVRLPTVDEYRSWFPTPEVDPARPRYGDLSPSGVDRLEEWSGVQGQPERIRFARDLRWGTSVQGIRAIHAVDVLEWTERKLALNPLDTFTCVPETWGAYKRLKLVFRTVVPVEVAS